MANDPEKSWLRIEEAERIDRARLSGPGLRAFDEITEDWGLSVSERCVLLGDPSDRTYRLWMRRLSADTPTKLSEDILFRISIVLGIHKLLTNLFADHNTAMAWLKGRHRGAVFGGRPPLKLMLDGTQVDLLSVRRHLECWPHGSSGKSSGSISCEPVKPSDIIFL